MGRAYILAPLSGKAKKRPGLRITDVKLGLGMSRGLSSPADPLDHDAAGCRTASESALNQLKNVAQRLAQARNDGL